MIDIGRPGQPWLVPATRQERAMCAASPHDPAARPCWCGDCQARQRASSARVLSTPVPLGAGSMTDPDGYGSDLGHLVDPSGSGQGRWLATPVAMWNDVEGRGKRKEFLR